MNPMPTHILLNSNINITMQLKFIMIPQLKAPLSSPLLIILHILSMGGRLNLLQSNKNGRRPYDTLNSSFGISIFSYVNLVFTMFWFTNFNKLLALNMYTIINKLPA